MMWLIPGIPISSTRPMPAITLKITSTTVTAVDAQTVLVKAKLDADGNTVNPLMVVSFLDGVYVCQKAWTQTLEARTGSDATAFLADTAEDVVYSGPYHRFFADDTKVVYVRDDNYWGPRCLHVGQAADSEVHRTYDLQG